MPNTDGHTVGFSLLREAIAGMMWNGDDEKSREIYGGMLQAYAYCSGAGVGTVSYIVVGDIIVRVMNEMLDTFPNRDKMYAMSTDYDKAAFKAISDIADATGQSIVW